MNINPLCQGLYQLDCTNFVIDVSNRDGEVADTLDGKDLFHLGLCYCIEVDAFLMLDTFLHRITVDIIFENGIFI